MMKKIKNIRVLICVVLLVLIFGNTKLLSQKLKLKGKWNCRISSSDILEAGEDYSKVYESRLEQIKLSVINSRRSWTISVEKSDIYWNDMIRIYARRSSEGRASYSGYVYGGNSYQEIMDFNQEFFYGYLERTAIGVQYKIEGVSVLVPAENYETDIVFTITTP